MFYDTPEEWEGGLTAELFHERLLTKSQAAWWIAILTVGTYEHPKKSSKSSKLDAGDL